MTTQKFPQTIFVVREGEGEDAYLSTFEDPDGLEDDQVVAVYELSDVKCVKVAVTLVPLVTP